MAINNMNGFSFWLVKVIERSFFQHLVSGRKIKQVTKACSHVAVIRYYHLH